MTRTFENLAVTDRELKTLVEKYSGNAPRYTSYPTAVEFHSGVDSVVWQSALGREYEGAAAALPSSLYLHIPFCHSLCYFCACNKKIASDDSGVGPYIAAITKELGHLVETIGSKLVLEQLHWGGGTPNFLSPQATMDLFGSCLDHVGEVCAGADVSIEIDPRTITTGHLETYRRLGFSRISAGVQDFCPSVQEAINRIQPFELTAEVCEEVRRRGFSSLNIDLIYGLPGQSVESFGETIEKLLSLRPDRIALYGYAHVTWKKKVQRTLERHTLPSPDVRIQLFLLALRALVDAGYVYIGMDHFALPEDSLTEAALSGRLKRNFMGYSSSAGSRVLGIGVSAVSTMPEILAQNTPDLEQYQQTVSDNGFAISRGVLRTEDDRMRAELIEAILVGRAVDFGEFEQRWGIEFYREFPSALSELQEFAADGLIELDDSRFRVTTLGCLFLRPIATIFDRYFAAHQSSGRKVFSQSL